jgi:uncharacterized damage-inducible protein DinB
MNKTINELLIMGLESEATASRKCLERVPADKLKWKPHEKSMEFGYLATIVAGIPMWMVHMFTKKVIDFGTFPKVDVKGPDDLVRYFDANMAEAVAALKGQPDSAFDGTFELKNNGQLLASAPLLDSLFNTINHGVHHRGQLTVYMRLNDIPVPSVYGPSADDRSF